MDTITTTAKAKAWLEEYFLFRGVIQKLAELCGGHVAQNMTEEYIERACQAVGLSRARANAMVELGRDERRAILNKVVDLAPGLTPAGRRWLLQALLAFESPQPLD
jgi:hypothetical protein